MTSQEKNPDSYIESLPEERQVPMQKLRETILTNLPVGFSEEMSYGMIGYVVPKTLYPNGYHCDPKLPLPFLSIASQKNFIALYHMGIYADKQLHDWFVEEYPKHVKTKLDMGKSCIRFKNMNTIPFELIGKLVSKITPAQWIEIYEENLVR
ncbi:MAG TPA: DUF1801 domain-containing protein [Flavobacteriaceae bacterium]|nr:DUF1801 domain-containing protein [Flavobacteriaceae bacterium]